MANKNFVVHNGLTVGLLTIDAATGDINTPGNVNISGSVGVSSIAKNDSSISISDTGSGSSISLIVDGVTEHTVDADGVSLASGDRYAINGTSVLNATTLGSTVVNSSLQTLGNLTSLQASGTIRTVGLIYANSGTSTSSTSTGALVVTGGVGVSGGIYTGSDVYIAGSKAATADEATALAIALG